MRAHRTRVQVTDDHEVRVTLPSDFPAGDAEVIVLEAEPAVAASETRRLSVDELLAARLIPQTGIGSVTLEDMERAIVDGATGRGSV